MTSICCICFAFGSQAQVLVRRPRGSSIMHSSSSLSFFEGDRIWASSSCSCTRNDDMRARRSFLQESSLTSRSPRLFQRSNKFVLWSTSDVEFLWWRIKKNEWPKSTKFQRVISLCWYVEQDEDAHSHEPESPSEKSPPPQVSITIYQIKTCTCYSGDLKMMSTSVFWVRYWFIYIVDADAVQQGQDADFPVAPCGNGDVV